MCGLAGILFKESRRPVEPETLGRMAGAVAHRGPDAEGIWAGEGVGLAHRRLSIIDLAGGGQPLANEDGGVRVVFNGEIYNYRELRRELEKKGHRFRSESDTEVLVHLYEEEGERLVERLRGMFGFAVWDARDRRLLLARDRVGLKPLYYYRDRERLLFASEIKALLAAGVPREIDLEALEDYLAFGVVPGARSIFRHVRKLEAGHVLSVTPGDFDARPRRYWQLAMEPDETRSVDDWLEAVEAKFQETVAAHRIADVPVGAFLSGGLDSSAVVAAVAAESEGERLRTFSVGFEEERFSELPYARRVAERFGTRHVEEIVSPQAAESLEELVHFYDEPFGDSSAIPTMAISRVAREHVKVVLSGDGGDEAFGGYSRYAHDLREARLRRMMPRWLRGTLLRQAAACWPKADWLPRALRFKSALKNLSLSPATAYANTISLCRQPLRRQLFSGDARAELNGHRPEAPIEAAFGPGGEDPLRGMIGADVSMLLPDDFLTKVDRASMAVGLEVRPPLVDHEFLELAARVPSRLKVRGGETKWLLKKLCERRLPRDVVYRKKQGFEIPVDAWLRGPLRDAFEENVLSSGAQVARFIDQRRARRLYDGHRRRVGRHGPVLWSLLVLGCWMERYLSGDAAEAAQPRIGTAASIEPDNRDSEKLHSS